MSILNLQIWEQGWLLTGISGGKGGAEDKIKKMEECGITIAKSPSELGKTLFNKLSN